MGEESSQASGFKVTLRAAQKRQFPPDINEGTTAGTLNEQLLPSVQLMFWFKNATGRCLQKLGWHL